MTGPVPRLAWYRFRATFRRRWRGYVALTVLIGLVGGVALASVTAARRTDSSYPDFLAGTNPSDLIVQPTTTPPYAPAFLDGQLARLKHVSHVETGASFSAAILTPRGGIATFLITQVELVASPDGFYSDQDRLTIVRGHGANPARADQVVATTQAASVLGLRVGSRISVGVLPNAARTHSDFRKLKLTVVGLGVLNTQVVQDDIDRDRTGFLIGTPALAQMIVPCCAAYEYVGLQLVARQQRRRRGRAGIRRSAQHQPLHRVGPRFRLHAPGLRHLRDRGTGAAGDPPGSHRPRRVRAHRRACRAAHRRAVDLPAAAGGRRGHRGAAGARRQPGSDRRRRPARHPDRHGWPDRCWRRPLPRRCPR